MTPSLPLYGLRARAGFSAERPEVVVDSVYNYMKLATNMVRSGFNTEAALRQDAKVMRTLLDDAGKLAGANTQRIAEVRAMIAPIPAP